jgi:DNA polymerase-3 subunit alpha
MCDLEVCHRSHNYALANGILSCNSHAITYGAISTTELWLKYHYPLQFVAALINNTKQGKKKHGSSNVLVDYINYTRRRGIPVLCPDISLSREEFSIDGKSVRFGLRHVKNVATSAKVIEKFQPFSSVEDFYERVKVDPKQEQQEGQEQESETESDQDKSEAEVEEAVEETQGKKSAARRPSRKVVESLIAAGAFDKFGTRNQVLAEYWRVRELKKKKKTVPPEYDDDTWQKAEVEALGLCLSKPILYKEYEELIQKEKWYLVSEVDGSKKRVVVFGQITSVRQHVSKNGNMMHIVELSDGLDSIKFFVFQGGWDVFRDKYREGVIGAVPLNKFDEGDTRFFDDRAPCVVLKR